MESFVCRRCGQRNDRGAARFRFHGIGPHYCGICFAEDATGKRGFVGRFLLSAVLGVYVLAGTAIAVAAVGIPLTLLRVPWFVESSVFLRASVLAVPGIALGLLLWRRRGR